MTKVISQMHIFLDGFTAGPNGALEWARVGSIEIRPLKEFDSR
jgi:hypothetical protein